MPNELGASSVTTLEMQVLNMAFLLERLGKDCGRLQFLREFQKNAEEAIFQKLQKILQEKYNCFVTNWTELELACKKFEIDLSAEVIKWDRNEFFSSQFGASKLCLIDTGIGMDEIELRENINKLASSGKELGDAANFGVGAKISAAIHNQLGIVYISWKDGRGIMAILCKDGQKSCYGLQNINETGGSNSYFRELSKEEEQVLKPEEIKESGTVVVFLGNEEKENTTVAPLIGERQTGGDRWIVKYLNDRFFKKIPITTKCRSGWSAKNERDFKLDSMHGKAYYLDTYCAEKGIVHLNDCRVYWWITNFGDLGPKGSGVHGYVSTTGFVGVLYQDELYEIFARGAGNRNRLQDFGVIFGSNRIVMVIEPDIKKINLKSDIARTRLSLANDESLPWDSWASEFQRKFPKELKEYLEKHSGESTDSESVKKRLDSIKHLFQLPNYKFLKNGGGTKSQNPVGSEINNEFEEEGFEYGSGTLGAIEPQNGGQNEDRKDKREKVSGNSNNRNTATGMGGSFKPKNPVGRALQNLKGLANNPNGNILDSSNGDSLPNIKCSWVSLEDGSRVENELEDRAAQYIWPKGSSEGIIKINKDFRVFINEFKRWKSEYKNLPNLFPIIEEVIKSWYEQLLIEAVIGTLVLQNSPKWNADDSEKALSEEALTTVVNIKYLLHHTIKREIGSRIGKIRQSDQTKEHSL